MSDKKVVTYMAPIQPADISSSGQERIIDNRELTNSEGFVMGKSASTPFTVEAVKKAMEAMAETVRKAKEEQLPERRAEKLAAELLALPEKERVEKIALLIVHLTCKLSDLDRRTFWNQTI